MVVGLLGQRLIAEVAVEHGHTSAVWRARDIARRRPRDAIRAHRDYQRGRCQPQPRPTSKLVAFHLSMLPAAPPETPRRSAGGR